MTSIDINQFSNHLLKAQRGLFTTEKNRRVSYPEEGSDLCFEIEDSSFWFEHRKKCILEVVNRFPPDKNGFIFDVGGGNGYMSFAFNQAGFNTVLVEPSLSGVVNARKKRNLDFCINSSFEDAQFLPNSLAAVSAFDVVEHIEDDRAFLKSIYQSLRPGGRCYLTIPAYSWLWSSADDLGGHFRTYSLGQLGTLLMNIGFSIDYATYFFQFLTPVIFLLRSVPYRLFNRQLELTSKQNKKDHVAKKGACSLILRQILSLELSRISKLKKMNVGASCLICCTKR